MVDPGLALITAVLILGAAAAVLWPERGLWARWQRTRHLTERVLQEDALKHIHKWEMKGQHPRLERIAGALHISTNETAALLTGMQTNGLLTTQDEQFHLTPTGRETALHIIRAHRLWERHLAEETGYAETEWHGQAERREHVLSSDDLDELARRLGQPTHDPHGDPIPTAAGELEVHGGRPLTQLPLDTPGAIVHLEDEPELVYAQLVADGLHPGMPVRVVENSPDRIRFWANGNEHVLAPILANNISVRMQPETEPLETADPIICDTLTCLRPGETAEVVGLAHACRGAERRRFMDLGILPGAKITAAMQSPSGNPTAYQIRGALIALRDDQANLIKVRKEIYEN